MLFVCISLGTFYFIIGVVGGVLVVLLLLIFVSVCVTLSLKNKRSERNHCKFVVIIIQSMCVMIGM